MNDREIASAINDYLRALRRLGRKDVTNHMIARALALTDEQVESAFRNFAIIGAKPMPGHCRQVITASAYMSPLVELKSFG